jgi:U3 small nucleolar RNA-associated protein 10
MMRTVLVLGKYLEIFIANLITHHLKEKTLDFFLSLALSETALEIKLFSLNIIAVFLESLSEKPMDFQIIVPNVLIFLSNSNREVRSKAVQILGLIKKLSNALKLEKANSKTIYGYDVFYGPTSSALQYLEVKTFNTYLENLLNCAEEIIGDGGQYIVINMKDIITASSAQKQKRVNEIISFMLSNVLAMTNKQSQATLLQFLAEVDSPLKIKTLVRLLDFEVLSMNKTGLEYFNTDHGLLRQLIACFFVSDSRSLLGKSGNPYITTLMSILTQCESEGQIMACCWAIERISDTWFSSLDLSTQCEIFSALIDAIAFGNHQIKESVKQCLQSLTLSSEIISPKLVSINNLLENTEDSKRSKLEHQAEQFKMSVLVSFLEYLQFSSGVSNAIALVGQIVTLLNGLLNFPILNVEYPKQLLLAILEEIMRSVPEAGELSEDVIRTDLIVQCIRVTENPQTHNAALLLLAAIGLTHPQVVILNIMPVFTFMGANILRQDDNYSFHVVQQTLETIVPSLLNCGDENPLLYVKNIMDVFVNALGHIPTHRRLKLFIILIETLGEELYLGYLISLIVASPIIAAEKPLLPIDDSINHKKFALQLIHHFSPEIELRALDSIMNVYSCMPDSQSAPEIPAILDSSTLKTKSIQKIKLHLLDFVNTFLKTTLAKIGPGNDEEGSRSELHRNLIKCTMCEISTAMSKRGSDVSPSFNKYISFCVTALYDNLDAISNVLSLTLFLDVIQKLLADSDVVIKKRSMAILQERIKVVDLADADITKWDSISNSVLHIIRAKASTLADLEVKQHAIICLGFMAKHIGSLSLDHYSNIFVILIGKDGILHSNVALSATAISSIGAFVSTLGTRTIPYLSKFVPSIQQKMEDFASEENEASVIVIKNSLAAFDSLFESIPQFMSSYLPRVIRFASTSYSVIARSELLAIEVRHLMTKIPQYIHHRIVFPAISKQLQELSSLGSFALTQAVFLLNELVASSLQSSLLDFGKEWSGLFLNLFSYSAELAFPTEVRTI